MRSLLFVTILALSCGPKEAPVLVLADGPEASPPSEGEGSAEVASDVISEPSPPVGCPEGTYTLSDWSGEYPTPVVQVDAVVDLPAWTSPCADAPTRTCSVQPGLYHPWAEGADEEGYASVAPVTRYRLLRDEPREDGETERVMPAGTEVTDLAYLAEGYCLIEAEGEEFAAYCIGHRDPEIFEPLPSEHAEAWARQFFRVPCGDQPAWIALDPGWDAPEGVQQGDVLGYGEVGPAGSFPGGGL